MSAHPGSSATRAGAPTHERGSVTGMTMNRAPASTACRAASTPSTVPVPTSRPISSAAPASAAMASSASASASLRSAPARTPPSASAAPIRGASVAGIRRPMAMTRPTLIRSGMAGRSSMAAPACAATLATAIVTGTTRANGTEVAMSIRTLPAPELLVERDAYIGEGPVWDPRVGRALDRHRPWHGLQHRPRERLDDGADAPDGRGRRAAARRAAMWPRSRTASTRCRTTADSSSSPPSRRPTRRRASTTARSTPRALLGGHDGLGRCAPARIALSP